jgi:hypothetical protein
MAPLILHLGSRWSWVVNFTPWPLYPQGKSPWCPMDRRLGGPQTFWTRWWRENFPVFVGNRVELYLHSPFTPTWRVAQLKKHRDKFIFLALYLALGYGLDDRSSMFRFPAGAGNFSLHHRVQSGSGAHPASCPPMGTRGSFPGGKAAGAWSWPLTSKRLEDDAMLVM